MLKYTGFFIKQHFLVFYMGTAHSRQGNRGRANISDKNHAKELIGKKY